MTSLSWLAMATVLLQGLDARGRRHTAPLAEYVSVTLSSDRDSYYRHERLGLRITAKNTSRIPITARFDALRPRFGRTRIEYRHGGTGAFKKLDLEALLPSEEADPFRVQFSVEGPGRKTLQSGEEHSLELPMSVVVEGGTRRFVLEQVGQYEFKVRHADPPDDPNGVLESDVLLVDVVEPPASEREAHAAYTTDLATIVQYRGQSPQEIRMAAAFVERFPDSRYTPPVKEALLSALEYRKRAQRASDEELRLHDRLTADVDQTPPPELSFTAPVTVLWPVDGAMVPVTVNPLVELRTRMDPPAWEKDLAAHIALESIACDDSCDPATDVAGASLGTDDREFELRAARGESGTGRTYWITYSATTSTGIRLTGTPKITVPGYETPPAWSDQNVVYKGGEPVTYQGEVWRCIVGCLGRREIPPSPTTSGWVKLAKGKAWDFPVRYAAGAEVTHLGLTYKCLQRHISRGETPPASAPGIWTRIP